MQRLRRIADIMCEGSGSRDEEPWLGSGIVFQTLEILPDAEWKDAAVYNVYLFREAIEILVPVLCRDQRGFGNACFGKSFVSVERHIGVAVMRCMFGAGGPHAR